MKALAIFHLYPGHTDSYLEALEAEMKQVMPSAFIARERQSLSFAPVGASEAVARPARARQGAGRIGNLERASYP